MRTSSLLLPLALAACGSPQPAADAPGPALAAAEARQAARGVDEGRIACARGDAGFARTCTVEQTAGPDGLILTVRDAAGGFHRLRVTGDGRGVAAADGAEPATVSLAGANEIEVAVGDMRYRLPATTKAATAGR